MIMENPFTLSVYAGPKYFCNRTEETRTIINAFFLFIVLIYCKATSNKEYRSFDQPICPLGQIIGKPDNRTMRMLKKEIIFQDENLIKVYDIFFSLWLKIRN
ncbi:hypothetical protein MNBD_BACTEROID07-104 [hydrothermal vent metagenome]|uniref:Uncharacterized protein n=1 Tax=hydrothermal vent metagenome TaxID=652676 RepID=A0A3B0UQ42_9ZZZZ